jgi:hypothetical protein
VFREDPSPAKHQQNTTGNKFPPWPIPTFATLLFRAGELHLLQCKSNTGLAIYYSAFSDSSNPVQMQKRVFFCGGRELASLPDATGQAIFVAS